MTLLFTKTGGEANSTNKDKESKKQTVGQNRQSLSIIEYLQEKSKIV